MKKQWEVGKTYKLVDVGGFLDASIPNQRIVDLLDNRSFRVEVVNDEGRVIKTNLFCKNTVQVDFIFNHCEIEFFEEVTPNVVPTTNPVVEWLDKYVYVFDNDGSVGSIHIGEDYVYLTTDHGDVIGNEQVVEFINNRYELLQNEAKSNKQKELAEKKAKLIEELSAIDKELEGI